MKDLKTFNSQEKSLEALDKEIGKSNFIKIVLLSIGIIFTLIWLVFLLAGVISGGSRYEIIKQDFKSFEGYNAITNILIGTENYVLYQKIEVIGDWNPLYFANNTIMLLFVMFAPLGYILCLFLIAQRFGILKPSTVKQINRKALSIGYLKQDEFDYINHSINRNIGYVKENKEENN